MADPVDLLRAWRGSRSLREAADLLGCDPSYVHMLESRKRSPGRRIALAIRDQAGIPIESWGAGDAAPVPPAEAGQ